MSKLNKFFLFLTIALVATSCQKAVKVPVLLPPEKDGGKPIMEVFNSRQSSKKFTGKEFDVQKLSNLLWSANGFNRDDKRTVPTARNKQEIDLYVIFNYGVYLYNASEHKLDFVSDENVIDNLVLHNQNFVRDAYVNIAVVADTVKGARAESSYLNAGYVSENIYVYAASAGLGTVARVSFEKEKLKQQLKLNDSQEIILVQAVGTID